MGGRLIIWGVETIRLENTPTSLVLPFLYYLEGSLDSSKLTRNGGPVSLIFFPPPKIFFNLSPRPRFCFKGLHALNFVVPLSERS